MRCICNKTVLTVMPLTVACVSLSKVLSVFWEVESTHISMPGLKKQMQSDNVACLDLTRTFVKGTFSTNVHCLSTKFRVIVPFRITMLLTGFHELPERASNATTKESQWQKKQSKWKIITLCNKRIWKCKWKWKDETITMVRKWMLWLI